MPDLTVRLRDHADFFAETYGTRKELADLAHFMLERFLMVMRISGEQVGRTA
jgi:hypothetical protein